MNVTIANDHTGQVEDEFRRLLLLSGHNSEALALVIANEMEPLESVVQERYKAVFDDITFGVAGYKGMDEVNGGKLDRIAHLKGQFGFSPSGEIMQGAYVSCLEHDNFDLYTKLKDRGWGEPNVSPEIIKSLYELHVENANFESIGNIKRLTDVEIDISEVSVQKVYKTLITNGQYEDVRKLIKGIEVMGIKPPEELMQQVYAKILDSGLLHDIEKLVKLTNVKPKFDANKVQQRYSNMMDKDDHSHSCYMGVQQLNILSDINPSKENAQKAYRLSINRHDSFLANTIRSQTGVKPSEELVVDLFYMLLSSVHSENIKDIVGPEFSEATVQAIYTQIMSEEKHHYIGSVIDSTGVKPTEDMIQAAYMGSTLDGMVTLREHTGIVPNEAVVVRSLELAKQV